MGLPEKQFLSLDEVIARWKHWGCDHETLRNYAERGLLAFSVYFRDLGSHKSVRDEGNAQITHEVQVINFVSPNHVVRRLFYLSATDARRVLEAKNNEQVMVGVLYWTSERVKKQATGYPQGKYLSQSDLVVTREQCESFERAHHANGVTGLAKKAIFAITQPSQRKALRFLGGAFVVVVAGVWAFFKWYRA